MRYVARPAAAPLVGELRVPPDKSISHRAVLFSAMAEGVSRLDSVLDSADVRSTIEAVRALGARVEALRRVDGTLRVTVDGWGIDGPRSPETPIDCGNSGTTARLLLGVLAGWEVLAVLIGDDSLSKRPMKRVTDPLEIMGAEFLTRDGMLPVTIKGAQLEPIDYHLPVASAQLKTAILLAGARALGRTIVREPAPSRDHTERLLPAFGVAIGVNADDGRVWIDGPARLSARDVSVPRDPSSAAFIVGAALIVPGSRVTLPDVCLNPTRIGFLRVLERMGANVVIEPQDLDGPEPVGTIIATYTPSLSSTTVEEHEIPSLVDEIPLLAAVAARAVGTTRFEGVGELRVKESDRLAAISEGLSALGGEVDVEADTLSVTGPAPLAAQGGDPVELSSLGDHRLAMVWSVAALAGGTSVHIDRYEAVEVSYPAFADDLARLQGTSEDYPGS